MSSSQGKWFRSPTELKSLGVVGLNSRNARYVLPNNKRSLYPLVDNKLLTKDLAKKHGISAPETYAVINSPSDLRDLPQRLTPHGSFVIKPARGSGGKGILVITHCEDGNFFKPSGARLTPPELRHHASNILAGLYSLGGNRDEALAEYCVTPDPSLTELSYHGAPDIRIVLFHGYPALAMLRSATRESDGRANLHQGAIGIGIDLLTGSTTQAIHHGIPVTRHPDTKADLIDVPLPHWETMLEIATSCYDMTGLGYLGVDLMLDAELGPLLIEVNARPGLAIQMANGIGLHHRLQPIQQQKNTYPAEDATTRLAFSKSTFGAE